MGVSISDIYPTYPLLPTDKASNLVVEKFAQTAEYADEAFNNAESAIAALSSLFPLRLPDADIDYDHLDVSLGAVVDDPPTEPSDSITRPTPPSMGDLETIHIPDISLPDPPDDPAASFIYNETAYQSQLLTDLKAALLDYVQNGGTGLSSDVEDAIWARARARKDLLNEKVYDEALNFFAARGFTLPPGALSGRLTEALQEQTRADAHINYEVMIEQARLAQKNTQFTITSSVQLVGQEREYFDKIADRAFSKAKTVVDMVLNVYNAKMAGYVAQIQGKKVEADVAKVRGELQASKNRNAVDIFNAMISKYDAELRAEIGIVEVIGRIYSFKVAGYEAKARVAIANLNAEVEVFKGRVMQADGQARIAVAEAEVILRSYIEAAKVQAAAVEGAANVSAQLAASALSAVNASASLGYGSSITRADSARATTAISESAIKSESESL